MKPYLFCLCCALFACGGAVSSPLDDGGSKDGSANGDGSGGGTCGGPYPLCFCGSATCVNGKYTCPSDCGTTCDQMRAQIEAEKKNVTACCPSCKSIQCQGTAHDVCCDITVNGDATVFDKLVESYKVKCKPACPDITCPSVPTGICEPINGSQTVGRCL